MQKHKLKKLKLKEAQRTARALGSFADGEVALTLPFNSPFKQKSSLLTIVSARYKHKKRRK